ncbi:MAG: hypothetical protein QOJ61_4207, partial [Mycobacterium sp.]|nr:hypothetical protein [Mycobacterium sp.]
MGATITAARAARDAVQVLHDLSDNPAADGGQRAVLERFPGWGAAATLFDPQPGPSWAALADELDDLDPDAMKVAARVVDTSFYTPPALISHVYALLRSAGFTGGPVLDLGCGTGRFIGHAPTALPIDFTGVEVDPIAARIAAILHPQATIIAERLQQVSLPNNRFAAAVGNVPFSSSNVSDRGFSFHGPLHEYFLVRAARAVRPGGYVVMVTSRHTLDSATGLSHAVRKRADLLAAIRLPSGYFAAEGTDVVADVLVLPVREEDEDRRGWSGRDAATYLSGTDARGQRIQAKVSGFWAEHPDLVAGTMRPTGYHQNPLAVDAENRDAAVAAAFAAASDLLIPYPILTSPADAFADVMLTDDAGRKEGSFHVIDGTMFRVVDGALMAVTR